MDKTHGLVGTVVGDPEKADDFLFELAALMTFFHVDLVNIGWSKFGVPNEDKGPEDKPEEASEV